MDSSRKKVYQDEYPYLGYAEKHIKTLHLYNNNYTPCAFDRFSP